MTTSSDRNRPAQAAPGRLADAPGEPARGDFAKTDFATSDLAPKQPVAFSAASLRESGETPAEAARRLGMIDPAFMRRAGAPTATAGPDSGDGLVASRAPAPDAAPPVHAAPAAFADADSARASSLDAIAARRASAPELRGPPDHAPPVQPPETRPPADLTHPNLAFRRDETPGREALGQQPQVVDAHIRSAGAAGFDHAETAGSRVSGAAATMTAFIARWRARRAEARAAAAESPARQHKLTPKEKRWRRRRRRMVFEEALAWVLVPVILVGVFYALIGGLALFGMGVDDLVEGLNVVWAQLR